MLSIFVVVKFFFVRHFAFIFSSDFLQSHNIYSLTHSFIHVHFYLLLYGKCSIMSQNHSRRHNALPQNFKKLMMAAFLNGSFFRGKNSTRHIFHSKSVIQFLSIWSLYYMDNGVLLRITFGIWFNEYFRGKKREPQI